MTEGGTLYQLRTLINRRNITADPSKNVEACEDFIETVLHAHILCATMESFGMTSINDAPQGSTLFPEYVHGKKATGYIASSTSHCRVIC